MKKEGRLPSAGKRPKSEARVAIVGGGVVGVSILYWLTRLGWTDVVLLERAELASGSTWHAAGNVTSFHGLYDLTRIQSYSMELYDRLNEETDGTVGRHRLGCLFLAHHPGQLDEYRMQVGRSRALGLGYELLTPEEACALHPLMVSDGLIGALYDPNYGHVDPTGLTNALANAAKEAGAGIVRGAPVTELRQRKNGSWDIDTPKGPFHAHIVVCMLSYRNGSNQPLEWRHVMSVSGH
jgi:dimethylglycine dehydrogenase